eukprot:UN12949
MSRLLPDYLKKDLNILFVGINPGYNSAKELHHYAGGANHFWKLLFQSGIINKKLTYKDDHTLPEKFNLGLVNICPRATRSSADLTNTEIKIGGQRLLKKVRELKPKIICFNGKGIYDR